MNKKVFISYSWGDKEHQDWIVNLGTRLINDTVDVVLDKWSLKDGHDIHSFMEEMVKAEDIFRVLIVSDSRYKEKANEREGGVGTETQIITPNIYNKQKQEKFIPLVLERDEDGNPCLPIYLSSRKYIDFSQAEHFEDSYEELLRNILEAPAIPKPKLGKNPPAYITEQKVNLSETNNQLRTIENQIKKTQNLSLKSLTRFTETFLEKLWEFKLEEIPRDIKSYGEVLFESLKSYKPLREDFIQFIELISGNEYELDSDVIIEFFEKAPSYQRPREERGSWNPAEFDIFKIIFQELYIYVIAVGLKRKDYKLVSDLLYSKYFIEDPYSSNEEPSNFTFLYNYHENLERYMSHVYNRISGFGHYIITNLSERVKKDDIILADTICYIVNYLNISDDFYKWFPTTYLYLERRKILFLDKITSKKHFDKIKSIFDVSNELELKDKLNKMKENSKDRIYYGRGSSIPFVHELIKPDKIAIYR
jgi:hypothetical protein